MKTRNYDFFKDLKTAYSQFFVKIFVHQDLQNANKFQLLNHEACMNASESCSMINASQSNLC